MRSSKTSALGVEKETIFVDDYTKASVEEFIKKSRDFLKDHLELLIKDINKKTNFKLKDIYDVRFDHLFAVKKVLGWWSSFFDDSKLKPVNVNKQKTSFTENPRYVLTLFIRDLIDNVIYREDLTFEAFKKIINNFEKRKNIKFQTKRNLLLLVYCLLKKETIVKNPSVSNVTYCVLGVVKYTCKTSVLNLILWEN
ncbi:MAG: hypothetical protein ACD_49C00008G0002 [uncultured bacterium (gcode 4)]|uniref:Uncharacterized protein n=1 Tax=uncultured bacterium (gcode 4) TaxID=1234023 RepID=K2BDH0_9BACT|nr:MAG: hypothetical protein ACD_49C00008G0002 [uncultured bacterium (gcode 4)]